MNQKTIGLAALGLLVVAAVLYFTMSSNQQGATSAAPPIAARPSHEATDLPNSPTASRTQPTEGAGGTGEALLAQPDNPEKQGSAEPPPARAAQPNPRRPPHASSPDAGSREAGDEQQAKVVAPKEKKPPSALRE